LQVTSKLASVYCTFILFGKSYSTLNLFFFKRRCLLIEPSNSVPSREINDIDSNSGQIQDFINGQIKINKLSENPEKIQIENGPVCESSHDLEVFFIFPVNFETYVLILL